MKKLLFILPLFVLLTSCYDQERKCADFKTGKFRFETVIEGKTNITDITRTDSLQTETYKGKTSTASVRWLNDCEFVLQNLNPKNAEEKESFHMKILTTKGNTAILEYSIVGDTEKQKGTVTKID